MNSLKTVSIDTLKQIQLEILDYVHEFCEQNKITYFIAYGTLIGAVRHKGYIPWDDDIDIAMPRKDYETFIKIFHLTKSKYKLCSFKIDQSCPYSYAKVYDSDTVLNEYADFDYPIGINIDVFPIDGLPNDEKLRISHFRRLSILSLIRSFKIVKLSSNRAVCKNVVLLLGKIFFSLFSLKKIIEKSIKLSKKYDYSSSDKVAILTDSYGTCETTNRSAFKTSVLLEFEGRMYKAPIGYDEWLRNIYGDYMQFPPKDKQVNHHKFEAYIKD